MKNQFLKINVSFPLRTILNWFVVYVDLSLEYLFNFDITLELFLVGRDSYL